MKKVIHIGSQSQDVHTNTQNDCNAVVNALVVAIPNLTHIAVAPYMDYDSTSGNDQFTKWATAIHAVGKKMWLRSPGFNDWLGVNNVPLFITQTNYVVNPYFESNTNFWSQGGTIAISRVTTEFHQGVASMKIIGTTAGDFAYCQFADAGTPTVGHSYTLSCYLKGSGTVNLAIYDGVADNYSSNIVLSGTWTQYTLTATCQAAGMLMGVRVNANNAVTGYVDEVFMVDNATSPDTFTNHSITKYTTFINNNFAIFQSGDVFEPLPDEPENCTNWTTIYGGLGASPGVTAYNSFITDSIAAANTALANNSVTGVITTYVHTSPSATKDVITQTTANSLTADSTDDYPENGLSTATDMRDALVSEINNWIIPGHPSPNRPKHVTFGPSVYSQLTDADQSFTLALDYAALVERLSLDGITVWQFGATDNGPKSRLFDFTGGVWVARNAAKQVAKLFDSRFAPGNIYRSIQVGNGMSRSEGAT